MNKCNLILPVLLSAYAVVSAQDAATPVDSLRLYAKKYEKNIGTALGDYNNSNFLSWASKDPQNINYKTVAANYNMVVAENEMKYDATEPAQGYFSYEKGDLLCDFAEANSMIVRGHTLCWHSQLPDWIGGGNGGMYNNNNYTREQLLAILENHITNVVGHYKGRVHEWDVVNEAFGTNGKLRSTIWNTVIGSDFIDSAFVYAHRADPDALLYLNDFDNEKAGSKKSDGMFTVVQKMLRRNIPIHGVGMQCHFSVGSSDTTGIQANIQRYAELGLRCIITELDISLPSSKFDDPVALQSQAELYAQMTDLMMKNANCCSMIMWGFSDAYSWVNSQALIFDQNLAKKPAYYAIRDRLMEGENSTYGISVRNSDSDVRVSQTEDRVLLSIEGRPLAIKKASVVNVSGTGVGFDDSSVSDGIIGISELVKGIYIINIDDENNNHYQFKIIKR